MSIRRTRAVVGRTMRYSNSSRIVSLITEQYGLVKVVAKGVRRPKSRYSGALEPITLIEAVYYHRDTRELQNFSEAEIEQPWLRLKDTPELWPTAACIIDTAEQHTPREDPSGRDVFTLVTNTFDDLQADPRPDTDKHLWRFLMRLLKVTGYHPTLDRCVKCGGPVKGASVFFSYADGGVVCSCTEHDTRYGLRVSAGALMVMKSLMAAAVEDFRTLKLGRHQGTEVENAILQFLAYHTGSSRPPRALAYLRRMKDWS